MHLTTSKITQSTRTRTVLLTLILSLLPWVSWADEPLNIGVFSYRPSEIMQQRWQPFEVFLSQKLPGYQVKVLVLNQDEISQALNQNRIDLLFTTPPHFLKLREDKPLTGLLATLIRSENGVPVNTLGGVIFRLKSRTDIQTLKNLKHQTIASLGPIYLGGFIAQAIELNLNNIDVQDLNIHYTGSPHDKVVEHVLNGSADVGFVRSGVLEQMAAEGKLDLTQIEVMNRQNLPGYPFAVSTHLYPEWPMIALPHLPRDLTRKIASALLSLNPEDEVAQRAGIYGFDIPSSYLSLLEQMKDLRLEPFDKVPVVAFEDVWNQYKLPIILFMTIMLLVVLFSVLLDKRNRQILEKQVQLDQQNSFQYALLRHLPGMVFFKDRMGVYQFANPIFERFFGVPLNAIKGKTDYDFMDKSQADFFRENDLLAEKDNSTRMNEEWLTFPNGESSLYQMYKSPVKNQWGDFIGILGVGHDITLQRNHEHSLKLAASVLENIREGVIVADAKGTVLNANLALKNALALTDDMILGQQVFNLSFISKCRAYFVSVLRHLQHSDYFSDEIWAQTADGKEIALHISVVAVRDENQTLINYIAVLSDITTLKKHEQQLHKAAYLDPLTQLPNRRLLDDRIKLALHQASRLKTHVAIVFLDLDGFKPVNDNYGHEIGDRLLIEIARRLEHVVREGDTVSRVGGDEFVLVLNQIESFTHCEAIVQRVLVDTSQFVQLDGIKAQVTVSAGITLYPDDNCDADTLLRHADQSMYLAKNDGKNRYHFFNAQQELDLELRRKRLKDINDALIENEFELFYQPKIDLNTLQVVGFEALIRWAKPGWVVESLGQMLQLLDGTEQEIALGEWVMNRALLQLQDWSVQGFDLPVSINISPNHLKAENFTDVVTQILALYPKSLKSRLEIEVLESSSIESFENIATVLEALRAVGIKTALDDFGTGYSSLTHLRQLPIDYLKIDQSFVEGMFANACDANMVNSIIDLGHAMNKTVIAEGVSSKQHLQTLKEMGCDMAQGYAIAKPMHAEKVINWTQRYTKTLQKLD
ncbi:MAG: EAL domain-containing protein [Thiotrichales bacterium]|nr:EAL domain-containing protein [Thiotrichales bacterium]